jgi:hypothetical protein
MRDFLGIVKSFMVFGFLLESAEINQGSAELGRAFRRMMTRLTSTLQLWVHGNCPARKKIAILTFRKDFI